MNIRLTPEQEKIVQDELRSGHARTVEEVIGKALQTLRDRELGATNAAASNGAQREAVRAMLAFAEKNRVKLDGVSINDLIHEGHRL